MRLLAQATTMTDADRERADAFAAWLLDVGDGRLNGPDDSIEIPNGIIYPINIY